MSTDLEERIAHLERLTEELSDIVAEQAQELKTLKTRAKFLLEREAEREAENSGGVVFGDERPAALLICLSGCFADEADIQSSTAFNVPQSPVTIISMR